MCLRKAGLSPLDVLQMTTLDGARSLGRESSMGTVERVKSANLVLLGADPLASVQNFHKIEGVVRAGAYDVAPELYALKLATEVRLAALPPSMKPLRPPYC